MGTPNYMAPEQIEHPDEVDHRADIYALGVVFYELLTGELPIGRFPPPSKKVQVDVRLDDVVLRALEKEPSLRYQQASEFQSEVESLSADDYPATDSQDESATPAQRSDYEYRSAMTVFGLPLVHIASSRDPEGKRMRLASGIIAIGDIAIGVVAIGAFTFGGITIGPFGIGLMGFGGVVFGLLTALGGVAFGGYSVGGIAFGLVAAHGALPLPFLTLTEEALGQATFLGWLIMTVGFTIGAVAAGYAWVLATRARAKRPG